MRWNIKCKPGVSKSSVYVEGGGTSNLSLNKFQLTAKFNCQVWNIVSITHLEQLTIHEYVHVIKRQAFMKL